MAEVAVQLLTYLASYVTAPSVLCSEVVPPLVAVEDLTQSLSDVEVERRMEELELRVSEALGISLLEVHARYFRDSDSSERRDRDLEGEHERMCWLDEWAEEHQVAHRSYWEDAM
jgi:hypothetical protein